MAIGLYGPEYLQFSDGGPARKVAIYVFLPGTKTKAVVYSDKTGLFTGPNPVMTDERGELLFYAPTGVYDLYFADAKYTFSVELSAEDQVTGGGYEHTVVTPATLIQIQHGLTWNPLPLNLDSLGEQVDQDRVAYPAPGIIEVIFGAPFGPGKIYLS